MTKFKNFKPQDFQRDLQNINWDRALKINKNQTNQSFDRFFNVFETLLDAHAPLKKLTNKEVKIHLKLWLTNGIMTSTRQKDKLYKNLSRTKDCQIKQKLHKEFKKYRNNTSILTRISRANYCQRFFQEHKQNMLKTWEGIKTIINIRNVSKKNINCLNINNTEDTHQAILSDSFNKFFTTIAQKIESKIVPTNKNFTDYLQGV